MISTVSTEMNFKLHLNKVKGLNSDTQTRSYISEAKLNCNYNGSHIKTNWTIQDDHKRDNDLQQLKVKNLTS